MKTPFFLALFLTAYASCAQNTDSLVRVIKIAYAGHTNQRNWFKRAEKPVVDKEGNGGRRTLYTKQDTLQFMVESYSSETGRKRSEYHFQNGDFIFKLEQKCVYNAPIYDSLNFDPDKMKVSENRYYFHHGKMIRWVDERSLAVGEQDVLFKEKENEVLMELEKLLKDN